MYSLVPQSTGFNMSSIDISKVSSTGAYTGSGMFSDVYLMPNGEAIKTCNHANSDAWLWWSIVAMQNPDSEHTPNIKSIHINIHDNTFVAVMEALEDIDDDNEYIGPRAEDAGETLFAECYELCPFSLVNDTGDGHWNWMRADDGRNIWTDPFCYDGWI